MGILAVNAEERPAAEGEERGSPHPSEDILVLHQPSSQNRIEV